MSSSEVREAAFVARRVDVRPPEVHVCGRTEGTVVNARVVGWINGDPGQRAIHAVALFVVRWLPTHAFAVLVHRIVMRATSAGATQ